MSQYRQTDYAAPYSAGVPGALQLSMSDEFSARSPQLFDGDEPLPGWVARDPKWQLWNPGATVDELNSNVNATKQMLTIESTGSKSFGGFVQRLPLPAADGEAVHLDIYVRMLFAGASNLQTVSDLGQFEYGLILGGDLIASPLSASFDFCGNVLSRTGFQPSVTQGNATIAGYTSYDSLASDLNIGAEGPWPAAQYFRARLSQTRIGAANWNIISALEYSVTGLDWLPGVQANLAGLAAPLYQTVGVAQNSGDGTTFTTLVDFFRVFQLSEAPEPERSLIGGIRSNGAV